MRTPIRSRIFFGLVVVLVASAGGCKCGQKKPEKTKESPPIIESKNIDKPIAAEFGAEVKGGVRRFGAPRGQEVQAISASPDGSLLAAATGHDIYLWDPSLGKSRVVELSFSSKPRRIVALSPKRVAVLADMPTGEPRSRIHFLDAETAKVIGEKQIGGLGATGAALAGERLVVTIVDPPSVAVFDSAGNQLANAPLPGKPARVDVSADGSWAAVAAANGAVIIDVSGPVPTLTPVATGTLTPQFALPIGDLLVVAGDQGGRPAAAVYSRKGGDATARLSAGTGRIVAAATTTDGKRLAFFVGKPQAMPADASDTKVTMTGYVFDTTSWQPAGIISGGPAAVPTTHSVPLDEKRAVVLGCHSSDVADLSTLTVTEQLPLPSPAQGPCLDGAWVIGNRLAARDGNKIVSWPKP